MASPPTDACTSFGKHAYTNEDGFGMEYKYNLSFQGTILNVVLSYFLSVDFQVYFGGGLNMCSGLTFVVMFGRGLGLEYKGFEYKKASNGGLNGFVEIDNYHDFTNCYVDITAAPECEAISISYASVAVEDCGINECNCDRFWISTENKQFDFQCGCKGDGCDDVVWGRNVTDPITGEEDYYYYDQYTYDGKYNYTYIYNDYGTMGENGAPLPVDDGQTVLGNKFRFNFQSGWFSFSLSDK